MKSSGAEHINVQLVVNEEATTINVSDNGNGQIYLESDGSGLRNIRERLEAIGGRMDIYSKPDEGTEINIEIPKNHL